MYRVRRIVNCAAAWERGLSGRGVGVAVLDSGIARHPDFGDRLLPMRDFVGGKRDWYDDYSHGTHVAGIIGGSGKASAGRYRGMAPKCRLLPVKVLDGTGSGKIPVMLEALDWLAANGPREGIRLVNLSAGAIPEEDSGEGSELIAAVERVWSAGMIVVTSAGNGGPRRGSIAAPGISRKVITVGASDDHIRPGRGGLIHYSGRGPTADCIVKPEIAAPGQAVTSCFSRFAPGRNYTVKSGTSMSAAVVTGALALLLEKEPGLSGLDVKMRLFRSAVDMGLPAAKQGWGVLDAGRLTARRG